MSALLVREILLVCVFKMSVDLMPIWRHYLYPHHLLLILQEIRQAAEFLDLPELLSFIHNIHTHEEFLNNDVRLQYRQVIFYFCFVVSLQIPPRRHMEQFSQTRTDFFCNIRVPSSNDVVVLLFYRWFDPVCWNSAWTRASTPTCTFC